jgi:hypothetical protein
MILSRNLKSTRQQEKQLKFPWGKHKVMVRQRKTQLTEEIYKKVLICSSTPSDSYVTNLKGDA